MRNFMFIALAAATACTDDRPGEPLPADSPPAQSPGASPAIQVSAIRARADSVLNQLLTGLTNNDPRLVSQVRDRRGEAEDTVGARVVITDFENFFGGRTLTSRPVRVYGDTATGEGVFEYELTGPNGATKPVGVTVDRITGDVWAFDELLSYSPAAHGRVRAFLDAIKNRDANRLARALTADDLDYPVEKAEDVIRRYERAFDLNTMTVRYDGLGPARPTEGVPAVNRAFLFTITGTKGGAEVTHKLEVIHGDGLTGIRDEWVPEA